MSEFRHIDHAGVTRSFISRSNKLSSIECTFRKKLNKDFSHEDWCSLFAHINLEVPVCNICKLSHVPFQFVICIQDDLVRIAGLVIPKKYKYCYGKSRQCREMSKGRKMNPNSAKFISLVMGVSEEEAKSWIRNNNSSPFYRENFSTIDQYREFQTRDLSWHKKRYGEELGIEKFNDLIKKQNHARSLAGHIERHGIDGRAIYEEVCKKKDSMTFDSFRVRNRKTDEDDLKSAWARRVKSVGLTKESFIKKHGTERFLACMKTRMSGRTHVSRWSLDLIERIKNDHLKNLQIVEIRYGLKNEICIHDIENKRSYYYDLFIETPQKKMIVEFNGNRFHADPRIPPAERHTWKNPFDPDLTWEQAFKYEEQKLKVANQSGIDVLVVWDYESEDQILKKVADFIHG